MGTLGAEECTMNGKRDGRRGERNVQLQCRMTDECGVLRIWTRQKGIHLLRAVSVSHRGLMAESSV
jgi:hypothetical protein